MKHSNRLRITSYHINRTGEASLPFLFWYMQEIAWEHAHELGFGFDHLRQDRLFWVLARLHVKLKRRPRWTETISLDTWSRGTDGFFAYRDFQFLDSSQQEIITATSSWLVLDLDNKRIQRLRQLKNFPEYKESILGANPEKVESAATEDDPVFKPVHFNDVDINQHINSGRYLERIDNDYTAEFQYKHDLKEISVNFIKEGMPQDLLAVRKQLLSSREHLCSVIRQSDGADLIRARLIWEERTNQGLGDAPMQ
ncbi:MAG TPA: thioesterase [bacterium]|nr:thioesterase [bacterium]